MHLLGPLPADTAFNPKVLEQCDVVFAMYHDQGLTAFKTLAFGNGVNFTAGLEKIRTSPDHGTAYAIAGKGKAEFNSFKEAIFMAIKLFRAREEYLDLTENKLEIQKEKKKQYSK